MKKPDRAVEFARSRRAFDAYLAAKMRRERKRQPPPTDSVSLNRDERRVRTLIPMPSVFCLDENFAETSLVLNRIRRSAAGCRFARRRLRNQQKTPGSIDANAAFDFRTIRSISPAAALVLAAEYDRWRTLSGRKLFTYRLPEWDPNVRSILIDLGFLDLLDVRGDDAQSTTHPQDIRILKFMSGEGADGVYARDLQTQLAELAGDAAASTNLYDGIVEAMANVAHHAYPDWHEFQVTPVPGRWWMTGSYDSVRRALKVIIFDQGVTIPIHLPRSTVWEEIRGWLIRIGSLVPGVSVSDDSRMIEAAMEMSRTSTHLKHRGKGLADMLSLFETQQGGYLRIISRRGECLFRPGEVVERQEHGLSIGGTLIEWEVLLGSTDDGGSDGRGDD